MYPLQSDFNCNVVNRMLSDRALKLLNQQYAYHKDRKKREYIKCACGCNDIKYPRELLKPKKYGDQVKWYLTEHFPEDREKYIKRG